jgi:hypothetical protein
MSLLQVGVGTEIETYFLLGLGVPKSDQSVETDTFG